MFSEKLSTDEYEFLVTRQIHTDNRDKKVRAPEGEGWFFCQMSSLKNNNCFLWARKKK